MRVGIDIMGGDHAPRAAVEGVILASSEVSEGTTIVLFGDQQVIETILKEKNAELNNIEIVHTTQVIEMGDSPTQGFVRKPDSSIVVGFNHLKNGYIDAFTSAGSTGAMMVGSVQMIKVIDGVIRPTITTPLPTFDGKSFYIIDVGLGLDVKPEVLYQYGIIGSIFAETQGVNNPKVGLLNIGEEEEKGNVLTKATYALMKDSKDFNFYGNIESSQIFKGKVDVVVCDGFVGNIVLKTAEGLHPYLAQTKEIQDTDFVKGFDAEAAGGTPVLGINSAVFIGHGCSSSLAMKNMILGTEWTVKTGLVDKIKKAFSNEKN